MKPKTIPEEIEEKQTEVMRLAQERVVIIKDITKRKTELKLFEIQQNNKLSTLLHKMNRLDEEIKRLKNPPKPDQE